MDAGDSQIVAQLATDLRHSYERLVATYWHRLRAFILRQVGSPQDAEEVTAISHERAENRRTYITDCISLHILLESPFKKLIASGGATVSEDRLLDQPPRR